MPAVTSGFFTEVWNRRIIVATKMMKKTGAVFGCLLPLLLGLLCQIVTALVISFGYSFYLGIKMAMLEMTDPAEQTAYLAEHMSGNYLMLVTAAATAVTLIAGALWYRKYKPETDWNLKEVVNRKLLAVMVCLGLSLQLLISMCLSTLYPVLPQNLTDQYSELMEQLVGGNIWLSLFVTVLLAPLAEELLFRGVTLKKAQKNMPFLAANVLQAVLFGVYHMNLIQGVYAFVLGMVLGFTANYFHSIWASILLHACVNASAEVLNLLPAAVTDTVVGAFGIAAVGVVLLFLAAKLYPSARKEPSR